MKTIKNIFGLLLVVIMATSCLDDTLITDGAESSPLLVGFVSSTQLAGVLADGEEYPQLVKVALSGPSLAEATKDIKLTFSVAESSTAVEGEHFTLASNTVTVPVSEGLIGANIPFTILSDGMDSPSSKILILNITSAEGGLVNSKTGTVTITINYLCPSDLAGSYSASGKTFNIERISEGLYRSEIMGGFAGDYWFEFSDLCGVLTLTDWQHLASYPIVQHEAGYVEEGTGNLVFPSTSIGDFTWYSEREMIYTKN